MDEPPDTQTQQCPNVVQTNKIREDLVDTARRFLTSKSIVSSSIKDKTDFLRKKGLTDEEIKEAFSRAESDLNHIQNTNGSGSSLKKYSIVVLIFGGTFYALYRFYKDYIVPFLADQPSGQSPKLQEALTQNTQVLTALEAKVTQLQQTADNHSDTIKRLESSVNESNSVEIEQLKNELKSVKKLLLSRHQFPQTPAKQPVLPSWLVEESKLSETSPSADGKNSPTSTQQADDRKSAVLNGSSSPIDESSVNLNDVSDGSTFEDLSQERKNTGEGERVDTGDAGDDNGEHIKETKQNETLDALSTFRPKPNHLFSSMPLLPFGYSTSPFAKNPAVSLLNINSVHRNLLSPTRMPTSTTQVGQGTPGLKEQRSRLLSGLYPGTTNRQSMPLAVEAANHSQEVSVKDSLSPGLTSGAPDNHRATWKYTPSPGRRLAQQAALLSASVLDGDTESSAV